MAKSVSISRTIVAAAATILISAVLSATPAYAQTTVGPQINAAASDCPAGTQTVKPSASSIARNGAQALLPADVFTADPDAANDPVLQKMAALNATWLDQVDCTIEPFSNGAFAQSSSAGPASASQSSYNWSGYEYSGIDTAHSYYSHASMDWTAPPAVYPPASSPTDASIWPGIGSGHSSDESLVQAGSDSLSGPAFTGMNGHIGPYSGVVAWYEIYPQENEVVINNLPAKAGSKFLVDVQYDIVHNTVYFALCVDSLCGTVSQALTGDMNPTQVEYIAERALFGGKFEKLTLFGVQGITSAGGSEMERDGKITDGFTAGYPTNLNNSKLKSIQMTSCSGSALATPGSINSIGNFSITWKQSGTNEKCRE